MTELERLRAENKRLRIALNNLRLEMFVDFLEEDPNHVYDFQTELTRLRKVLHLD